MLWPWLIPLQALLRSPAAREDERSILPSISATRPVHEGWGQWAPGYTPLTTSLPPSLSALQPGTARWVRFPAMLAALVQVCAGLGEAAAS
jgi:hypothetical protein